VQNRKLTVRFLAVVGVLILLLWARFAPSEIVNFKPSEFSAKAERHFFYSIGDDLKYSDELNSQAPTLIHGRIKNFLVAPDNRRIAVVVENGLFIVAPGEQPPVRKVIAVGSIYRGPKPLGEQFFRDEDFQWSRDSLYLYLINDEYYNSKGSQLFSIKGELWRYGLGSGRLEFVLKPFPAFNYFFGPNSRIYFAVPTESGDYQLRYFDGNGSTTAINSPEAGIPADKLARILSESPFFSFPIYDYEQTVLSSKGVRLVVDETKNFKELRIGSKSYLAVTQGYGLKGTEYCLEISGSAFMPGDRYFLLNVPECGNYSGQLLFDTLTGKYQRLPKDSRLYPLTNTGTFVRYRITVGGISPS
jgi:hypothetical protein